MNWEELYSQLSETERQEMTLLLLKRVSRPPRWRIQYLRPIHLLLPAAAAQMGVLIWSVQSLELMFARLMAGNLVVVALAVLPSAFSKPRFAAHWVR